MLIGAPVVFLAVFFGYPVVKILSLSFTVDDALSLGNYRWFFDNPVNLEVMRRTFTTATIVTAVCLVVAYPYAYLMTVVGSRWRGVLLILVLIPFWTSLMTRNFAWLVLLRDGGPVDSIAQRLGFEAPDLLGNVKGVVLAMAQILLPFMLLPLYATLRTIDRSLMSAAASLGARPSVAFVRVYLPQSLPGVMAGSLLVFVLSLGFFLTPAIIGSPQDSLLSQLIVIQVEDLLAWGHAGAMAMILLALTALLVGLAAFLGRRNPAFAAPRGRR